MNKKFSTLSLAISALLSTSGMSANALNINTNSLKTKLELTRSLNATTDLLIKPSNRSSSLVATHYSHQSHQSHRSHSSHYSSGW